MRERVERAACHRQRTGKPSCDKVREHLSRIEQQIADVRDKRATHQLVHRPLAQRMRHMGDIGNASLVVGHKMVVRNHVGEQVTRVADEHCAVFVTARNRGESAQCRPAMRRAEGPGSGEPTRQGKVRKTGTRKNQPWQTKRCAVQRRVGQRGHEENVLRKVQMRLEAPGQGIERQQREQQSIRKGPSMHSP